MKGPVRLFIFGIIFFSAFETVLLAETQEYVEENSSEALEMIAVRMQSLSANLAGMPELPDLNQTINLPLENGQQENSDPSREEA